MVRVNTSLFLPSFDRIIYILQGDLDSYPWYHGLISRAEADTRLKQKALVIEPRHEFSNNVVF